jgi:adenylate cyclase class 2
MNHEIEAKIKVEALEPVAGRLQELGAQFLHTMQQADTYFMDTHKLLHKNDCGLRIRRQSIDAKESAYLTFKGAREKTKYKSRPEHETGVSDPNAAENILQGLGYQKRLKVEKKRSVWRLDNCEVCLDELPDLGCFVEVEGPDEEVISNVLAKLSLQDKRHIPHSYASMVAQTLKKTENECFFQ